MQPDVYLLNIYSRLFPTAFPLWQRSRSILALPDGLLTFPISRSMTENEPKFEPPWPEFRQCHQPQGWLDAVTEPTWHNQSLMELPIHGVLVYLDRSLPECTRQKRRFLGADAA